MSALGGSEFIDRLVGPPLVPQLVFAVGYVLGYVLWSRAFYRKVDPWLRRRVGDIVGARLVWVMRKGSLYASPMSFQLPYNTWSWGIKDPKLRTIFRDGLAYILTLLLVYVLAGMLPAAIFLLVFLYGHLLGVAVGLPLLVATIVIYSTFWSGWGRRRGMPG